MRQGASDLPYDEEPISNTEDDVTAVYLAKRGEKKRSELESNENIHNSETESSADGKVGLIGFAYCVSDQKNADTK